MKWIMLVVVLAIAGSLFVAYKATVSRDSDVVCYTETGKILFYAEKVTVIRSETSIQVSWPDGRTRRVLSGSCEWAPHGEGTNPEKVESWRGPPEDRSVRWASR